MEIKRVAPASLRQRIPMRVKSLSSLVMQPLRFKTNKVPASAQKLRGGYYTPDAIARFMVDWALRNGSERVLEPSCGDGNFLVPTLERLTSLRVASGSTPCAEIVAIEIQKKELEKAKSQSGSLCSRRILTQWVHKDFFSYYSSLKVDKSFDVVIGNPPFIRFQHFNAKSRDTAFGHLRSLGYKPTKLANAWAAFVQLSIELLKEDGRIAMILPAELLQVQYAGELRERLTTSFERITLITFKDLVFDDIQQEIVLLLAEGRRVGSCVQSDINTVELTNSYDLKDLCLNSQTRTHLPVKHSRKGMKWTSFFLTEKAFKALDEAQQAQHLLHLGALAEVDVGVVTGRNSFFVLDVEEAKRIRANHLVVPVIGKTSALKSICFSKADFLAYEKLYPSRLLNLRGSPTSEFSGELKSYLRKGKGAGIGDGYKCRIRNRWYDVPSIHIPDAFAFRQIHQGGFLVENHAGASSTDTVHRVKVKQGINVATLCGSSVNSLTLAWAEVCGRSYGGGVLELEPREAEELPIPYSKNARLDNEKVDALLRKSKLLEVLDYVDELLLHDHLGIDRRSLKYIREAWQQLRDRRINRKSRPIFSSPNSSIVEEPSIWTGPHKVIASGLQP